MEFGLKEALGVAVAIICLGMVFFALYNVGLFDGIKGFVSVITQNKIVSVS